MTSPQSSASKVQALTEKMTQVAGFAAAKAQQYERQAHGDSRVEDAAMAMEDVALMLRGELEAALHASPSPELAEMEARKDAAYEERNRVVAAFAKAALLLGHRAGVARTAIEG